MRTTLENLQQINLNMRKLPSGTTDKEWREMFYGLKLLVSPVSEKKMKIRHVKPLVNGYIADETYSGETEHYRYCCFINSILSSIRKGETDYCFFVYQIADLLKFEPDLKATWDTYSDCFVVSL